MKRKFKKIKNDLFEKLKEENVFSYNCSICNEAKKYYVLISKLDDGNPYSGINLSDNMFDDNFIHCPEYICKNCFLEKRRKNQKR